MTIFWFALMVGCAATPDEQSRAPQSRSGTCRVLRECFTTRNQDVDGCPDFELTFAPGSTGLSLEARATLDEVVCEATQFEHVELGLVGVAGAGKADTLGLARAETTREWLERRGVRNVSFREEGQRGGRPALWFKAACTGKH